MRPHFATILLLVAFLLAIPVTKSSSPPGRWVEITNLKDKHVVEVAEFAVRASNGDYFIPEKQLRLSSVDAGGYWEDFGTTGGSNRRYRLVVSVINVTRNINVGRFLAVVDERQSQDKKLVSFTPLYGQ
ncbi:unnamed protein product [Linum tenue]|uniref:Uncharacterized protein n=1 Tax=Linum tenue TaxID=586396 RepID=A0AAV0GPH8_9ROSI|nr:unnamed protein product [Linum tenue]